MSIENIRGNEVTTAFSIRDKLLTQLSIIEYALNVMKAQDNLSSYLEEGDVSLGLKELAPVWEQTTTIGEITDGLLKVVEKVEQLVSELYQFTTPHSLPKIIAA